jgi:hypothetical protein
MTSPRSVAVALLATAIVAGTVADRPPDRPPLILGGYRVLAADFHTHSSIWSDGTLTPWGLVLEADHQGLDAIAITGHDQTIGAHLGHWYARTFGGPTTLVGDEVLGDNGFHITAAGITDRSDTAAAEGRPSTTSTGRAASQSSRIHSAISGPGTIRVCCEDSTEPRSVIRPSTHYRTGSANWSSLPREHRWRRSARRTFTVSA